MSKPSRVQSDDLLLDVEIDPATGRPRIRDVVTMTEDWPTQMWECCSDLDCRCQNGSCYGYRDWSDEALEPHGCDECPQTPPA